MSANFPVNFELIGGATSLVQAMQLAVAELHRAGASVASDSARLGAQISSVFAAALRDMNAEELRFVQSLRRRSSSATADQARATDRLLGKGLRRQQIQKRLEKEFGAIKPIVNENLIAKGITDGLDAKRLRLKDLRDAVERAIRDAYLEAIERVASDRKLGLAQFAVLREKLTGLGQADLLGPLGGQSANVSAFVQRGLRDLLDDNQFAEQGLARVEERIRRAQSFRIDETSTRKSLRKTKNALFDEISDIREEIERASERMNRAGTSLADKASLQKLVTRLRQNKTEVEKVIAQIAGVYDEFYLKAERGSERREPNRDFIRDRLARAVDYTDLLKQQTGTTTNELRKQEREFTRFRNRLSQTIGETRKRIAGSHTTLAEKGELDKVLDAYETLASGVKTKIDEIRAAREEALKTPGLGTQTSAELVGRAYDGLGTKLADQLSRPLATTERQLRRQKKSLGRTFQEIDDLIEDSVRRLNSGEEDADGRRILETLIETLTRNKRQIREKLSLIEDEFEQFGEATERQFKRTAREFLETTQRSLQARGVQSFVTGTHQRTRRELEHERTVLRSTLKGIANDIRGAEARIREGVLERGEIPLFQGLIDDLRDDELQIRRRLDAIRDDFKQFRLGAIGSETNRELFERLSRPLTERLSPRLFHPSGRRSAELIRDRAELRRHLAQIQTDISDARRRLASDTLTPKQVRLYDGVIEKLKQDRAQIGDLVRQINTEVGQKLRSGPLGRILTYLRFSLVSRGFYSITSAVRLMTQSVIEATAEFQRLRSSFAAILAEPILEQAGPGAKISSDLLADLTSQSDAIFQRAQIQAIKTVATTKEYVTALQSALAVGQQVGLTQEQIEEVTRRMVLSAGAFGIEMEKVGSSIGQIFTGSVRVTNQLARNLGIATREQRKLLKESIEQGRLYTFLLEKTEAFAETGAIVENNFINVAAALQDIFEFGGARAIDPIFTYLNQLMIQIRDTFIGDTADEIFLLPLRRAIRSIQDTIIDVLPNVHALFTETGFLVRDIGRYLGGEGTSLIKLVLDLLTSIVKTVRGLTGETDSWLGVVGQFLPWLLVARVGVASLTRLFGGLRAGAAGITSEWQAMLATVRSVGHEMRRISAASRAGARTSGAATASSGADAFLRASAIQGANKELDRSRRLTDAASRGWSRFRTVVSGTTSVISSLGSVLSRALGWFALITVTVELATQLFTDHAGAAEAAADAHAKLSRQIEAANERLAERTEGADIATAIKSVRDAARAIRDGDTSLAAVDRLADARDRLRQFVGEEEALLLEAEGLTEKALVGLRDNFGAIAEEFDAYAKGARAVRDLSASDIKRLRTDATALREQFTTAQGRDPLAADFRNQARHEENLRRADALDRRYAELTAAMEVFAREYNTSVEAILANPDLFDRFIEFAERMEPIWQRTVDDARQASLSIEDQFSTIADRARVVAAETARYNNAVASGTVSNAEEIRDARDSLEEASKKQNQAERTYLRTLFAIADGEQEVAIATHRRTLVALRTARDREETVAKEIVQTRQLIESKKRLLEAERQYVAAFALGVALSALDRDEQASRDRLAEVNRRLVIAERINGLLVGKEGEEDEDAEAGRIARGRDPLQDYLKLLDQELDLVRDIQQRLRKNVDEVIDERLDMVRRLRDAGGLDPREATEVEQRLLVEQFNAFVDLATQYRDFVARQERAAREAARRAEEFTRRAEAAKAEAGRTLLEADTRDRELEAFLKFTRLQLDAYSDYVDRARALERALTDSVRGEVTRRIDLLRTEREHQRALQELVSEAEQADLEGARSRGELSGVAAARRESDIRRRDRDRRRQAAIEDAFPLASPEVRRELLAAVDRLRAELDARIDKTAADALASTHLAELSRLLESEFPRSIESALRRIGEIQTAAREVFRTRLDTSTLIRSTEQTTDEVRVLLETIAEADTAIQAALSSEDRDAAVADLARHREQTIKQLSEKISEIAELEGAFLETNLDAVRSLVEGLALLEQTTGVLPASLNQLKVELVTLEREAVEDINREREAEREALRDAIALDRERLELERERLAVLREIIDREEELGILTGAEARRSRALLIDAELALVARRRASIERELSETVPRVSALDEASREARDEAFRLADALSEVRSQERALRIQLVDLGSVFSDTAEGFARLGEAFGGFTDTEGRSRAAARAFGPVFTGLARIFEEFERRRRAEADGEIRRRSLPEQIEAVVARMGSAYRETAVSVADTVRTSIGTWSAAVRASITDPQTGFTASVRRAGDGFAATVELATGGLAAAAAGLARVRFSPERQNAPARAATVEIEATFNEKLARLEALFRAQFGRGFTVTSRDDNAAHRRIHGLGNAADIRTRDLTREQVEFLVRTARELSIAVRDFSTAAKVAAHNARVAALGQPRSNRATGTHVHLNNAPGGLRVPAAAPAPSGDGVVEVRDRAADAIIADLATSLPRAISRRLAPAGAPNIARLAALAGSVSEAVLARVERTTTSIDPAAVRTTLVGRIRSFISENVSTLLDAATRLVSGFASGGVGGALQGIGGATSAIGGLFRNSTSGILRNLPIIGEITGIIGGIFQVFGERARQQAERIAEEVSKGIDKLKTAFDRGEISLREAITGINRQVASARERLSSGKTGKKGGRAALAEIEQGAEAAIEALREQARQTRETFEEELRLLRRPEGVRDVVRQLNDLRERVREYLNAFDSEDDLLQGVENAMEFFRRSIDEIRGSIEESLDDLRSQLAEAREQYAQQREDILNEGRIDPTVSVAASKQRRLVELEREFQERRLELERQIEAEERKLTIVERRQRFEREIAATVTASANAMERAAHAMERAFRASQDFARSGFEFGQRAGGGSAVYNITVNVGGSNASPNDIGVAVARHLRLAGRTQSARNN